MPTAKSGAFISHMTIESPVALVLDERAYAAELEGAESKLIYKTVVVRPKWDGRALGFELENVGNVDIELLMLETEIPNEFISRHWPPTGPGYTKKSLTGTELRIVGSRVIPHEERTIRSSHSLRRI